MSYSIQISKNPAQANFVKISVRAKALHGFMFYRDDFDFIKEVADLEQPGAYVLFNGSTVYVGEADCLISRLETHMKATDKKWWSRCICFHTQLNAPDPLNKAMVKYLEYGLIHALTQGQVILANQAVPNEPFLSQEDKQVLEAEYLPQILEVLKLFNVCAPLPALPTRLPTGPISEKSQEIGTSGISNENNASIGPAIPPHAVMASRATAVPSVDLTLKEKDLSPKTAQIEHRHKCALRLDGRKIEEKNWSEMYLHITKYLVSIHGEEFFANKLSTRICDKKFTKEGRELAQAIWEDSAGKTWYLLTELGTEDKKAAIKKFCAIAHCDLKLLEG